MKIALRVILSAAIVLMVYGYWGAFTTGGNKVYDEMDGFIPFFMLLLGGLLFAISVVLLLLAKRK